MAAALDESPDAHRAPSGSVADTPASIATAAPGVTPRTPSEMVDRVLDAPASLASAAAAVAAAGFAPPQQQRTASHPKQQPRDDHDANTADDVTEITPPKQPLRSSTLPRNSVDGNSVGGGNRPKRMLQATLSFGGESPAEVQLRKDLHDRDVRIEQLTAHVADLERKATELEQESGRACAEAGSAANDLATVASRLQRYQEVMRGVMIDGARTQRREARRRQHTLHFELGYVAPAPCALNGGVKEVWVEGNEARRIINEQADLRARQKEIEAEKRKVLSVRTKARRAGDDDVALEVEELAEIHRMELAQLKANEQRLNEAVAKYEADKNAFVSEVRRITDEDSSAFAQLDCIGRIDRAGQQAQGGSGSGAPVATTSSTLGQREAVKHEERYVLLHLLGRGGFSEVWKAFDLVEGRFVACKVHHVSHQWDRNTKTNYMRHAERELDIQRQLDHPRLMKLHDVFEYDESTFVSVMEYSAGEDLDKRLKRMRTLKESEARIIMMQIVSALKHLAEQEHPVIHYDLKPANIIFHSPLSSCLEVKVTDFGLSKVVAARGNSADPAVELTSQGCGTFWYLPPECFAKDETPMITHKVDIWAAGVIFYQMLFGRRPFADDASQRRIFSDNLIAKMAEKGVEFPGRPHDMADAKDIIRRCLAFDPAKRPDIFQLAADPYFGSGPTAKRARQVTGSAVLATGPPLPAQPTAGDTMQPPA